MYSVPWAICLCISSDFLTFADAGLKLLPATFAQLDTLLGHSHEVPELKINEINHDINEIKMSTFFSIHAI